MYQKALEICRSVFGEKHHETARKYRILALVYAKSNKKEQSKELANKAIDIWLSEGQDHSQTIEAYGKIGLTYFEQDEYNKAIEYFNRSVGVPISN